MEWRRRIGFVCDAIVFRCLSLSGAVRSMGQPNSRNAASAAPSDDPSICTGIVHGWGAVLRVFKYLNKFK